MRLQVSELEGGHPFFNSHMPKVLGKTGADIGSPSKLHLLQIGESQLPAVKVSSAQERLACSAPFFIYEYERTQEDRSQGAHERTSHRRIVRPHARTHMHMHKHLHLRVRTLMHLHLQLCRRRLNMNLRTRALMHMRMHMRWRTLQMHKHMRRRMHLHLHPYLSR